MKKVVQCLRGAMLRRNVGELTDGQLLGFYVENRDETTFEALVQRHGPMVLGVCRRLLRNSQDAEDAFQATFLVLIRKAESVRPRQMVGNWLYGVAYQTALKARAVAARRNARERQVPVMPDPVVQQLDSADWRPVLDRELNGLPDKYRVPIVLCDLEGKGHEEAARQLGWPQGTLSGRLSRGRVLLARRLTRRGITLSAGSLAAAMSSDALASVPPTLMASTIQLASGAATTTGISAGVATLAEQVLRAMGLVKLKMAAAGVLALVLAGLGAGTFSYLANSGGSARQVRGADLSVRPLVPDRQELLTDENFIQGRNDMTSTRREMASWLLLGAAIFGAEQTADAQERRSPSSEVRGVVKSVDAATGTITLAMPQRRDEAAVADKTYTLAKDAEIVTGSGAGGGGRFGFSGLFKEVKLADLTPGTVVALSLSADEKFANTVVAEEPTVQGLLKAVDAKKNTLTISLSTSRAGRGERSDPTTEEKTLAVEPGAEIAVDDGRGRRFSIREAKLEDLSEGSLVSVRLSIDHKRVQSVLAAGPNHAGSIKAVDPAKKTLTIVVRPARGDDAGEDGTYTVADDALILLDDGRGRRLSLTKGKLADVQPGSAAMVKLSADQAFATLVHIAGPTLTGHLKAIDADKGVITIAIPKGRGEEPDEKSLTVAKDARVVIDGNPARLADLKIADNGPVVMLRLSLDQKAVQAIATATQGRR